MTICRREWEQVSEPEEWDFEKRRAGDPCMLSDPPERLRAMPSEPESVRRPRDRLDFLRALVFFLLREPVAQLLGEMRPVEAMLVVMVAELVILARVEAVVVVVVWEGVPVEGNVEAVGGELLVAASVVEVLVVVVVGTPKAWLSLVGVSGVAVSRQ